MTLERAAEVTVDDVITGHARERLKQLELNVGVATNKFEQAEALCRARAAELKAYSRQRDELRDALARHDDESEHIVSRLTQAIEKVSGE